MAFVLYKSRVDNSNASDYAWGQSRMKQDDYEESLLEELVKLLEDVDA